jgi:hypothetical protein
MMKKRFYLAVFALLLGALACNLPGSAATPTPPFGPDAAFTIAAQTVEAELTRVALAQPTSPPATFSPSPPPASPQPSSTASLVPLLSATPTAIPCNRASFVQDVTIPDGSSILTGSAFTKTWRLKNIGSCSWNSSYALVFDRGDKMGGPDAQPLSGNIAPGGTLDLSVSLTAPAAAGNYRGYWRLRDGSGLLFGLSTGSFWVDIKAVSPSATATPVVVLPPAVALANAQVVAAESGSVRSDGSVLSPKNVGDTDANVSSQAFLSFDISAIGAGANIVEVKLDFSDYDTLGNPFGLGCLRMYSQNYGSLDSGDYYAGSPLGAILRWCNASELSAVQADDDLKSIVQAAVGGSRVRFRVQFNDMPSNGNATADMVRLGAGLKLIITYNP